MRWLKNMCLNASERGPSEMTWSPKENFQLAARSASEDAARAARAAAAAASKVARAMSRVRKVMSGQDVLGSFKSMLGVVRMVLPKTGRSEEHTSELQSL